MSSIHEYGPPRIAPATSRANRALRAAIDTVVIVYTIAGYAFGLYCVTRPALATALAGSLLIAHTMTLSALLTHELMHQTLFRRTEWNDALARVLSLISGGCYFSYTGLKRQHFKHHRVKVGYDGFSITGWMTALPTVPRHIIVLMEFFYLPVLSVISRIRSLALPFFSQRLQPLRLRIAAVLVARFTCYVLLWRYAPSSVLWLFVGWLGMLNMLRVYDCFHHTFAIYPPGTPIPTLDRDYEQRNTYSSLFSRRHAWLNGLFLNYGYHNAHHAVPSAHWLDLPRIHETLAPDIREHCILFRNLVSAYHRHRIHRIYRGLGQPEMVDGRVVMDGFWGVIMNISFITYDF